MASFSPDWNPEYAPTDDHNKVRTIGLEFECTITNKDCPIEEINSEDYYDDEYKSFELDDWLQKNYELYIPGIGVDGSGYEFVTEPDSYSLYEAGGSERFKKFLKFLSENGEPKPADGTHIHVGKLPNEDADKTFEHLKWLVANYGMQMQKIFRRVTHWARTPSQLMFEQRYIAYRNEPEIEHIILPKSYDKISAVRYGIKEGMVINRGETFEFRGGAGTNNIDEALAWVQMAHNFVELAAMDLDTIETTPFKALVTGEYIEKYLDSLKDNTMRCIEDIELEQTIRENKYIQAITVPSCGGQLFN